MTHHRNLDRYKLRSQVWMILAIVALTFLAGNIWVRNSITVTPSARPKPQKTPTVSLEVAEGSELEKEKQSREEAHQSSLVGGATTEREDASQEIIDIIAEGIAQIELSLRASAVEVINASQWVALMERDLGQARTPGELEVCKRRAAEADANLNKIEQEWGFFIKAISPHDRGNNVRHSVVDTPSQFLLSSPPSPPLLR